MKTFEQYIREAVDFRLGGSADKGGRRYTYFPKDNEELDALMEKLRKERGEDGDFNDIDTSSVTEMNSLFEDEERFNGDISLWDTSNVTETNSMFWNAKSFNQDISNWDTSKVTDMDWMFYKAESFNQDISMWDVSNVTDIDIIATFKKCPIKEEYKPKFKI